MSDILEEFDKYISSNKEVLSVLPINTKKNRAQYVAKATEMLEKAEQIKEVIWNEITSRYERLIQLGLDKITHRLSCFFEGDLKLVNSNIKEYLDIFKNYGITFTADDFCYSDSTNEYMTAYLNEYNNGSLENSEVLKKTFENMLDTTNSETTPITVYNDGESVQISPNMF